VRSSGAARPRSQNRDGPMREMTALSQAVTVSKDSRT
jgi:hypothetical protein